jgi:hypothetical protein
MTDNSFYTSYEPNTMREITNRRTAARLLALVKEKTTEAMVKGGPVSTLVKVEPETVIRITIEIEDACDV